MGSKRIMDIEVLRAIAVLGVLFHHLPALFRDPVPLLESSRAWFGLWWGVDLFLRFPDLSSPAV